MTVLLNRTCVAGYLEARLTGIAADPVEVPAAIYTGPREAYEVSVGGTLISRHISREAAVTAYRVAVAAAIATAHALDPGTPAPATLQPREDWQP